LEERAVILAGNEIRVYHFDGSAPFLEFKQKRTGQDEILDFVDVVTDSSMLFFYSIIKRRRIRQFVFFRVVQHQHVWMDLADPLAELVRKR
jgi:hypothetical protein